MDPHDTQLHAAARRSLASGLWRLGQLDRAQEEFQRALTLYERVGNPYYIANVHQELGSCLRALGNVTGADMHYRKALSLWERIGNVAALANALNSMAVSLHQRGEYDQAMELFEKALDNAREAANARFQGYVLAGMGDVQRDLCNYAAGKALYSEALNQASRVADGFLTVYALDGLGNTARRQRDFAPAAGLLRQALAEAESHQSEREQALVETSLGVLFADSGDLRRALQTLELAHARLAPTGARGDLARVSFHIAQVLYSTKRWDAALQHLRQALNLAYEVGIDQFMVAEGPRAVPLLQYAVRRLDDPRIGMMLARIEDFRRKVDQHAGETAPATAEPRAAPTLEVHGFGSGVVYRDSVLLTPSDWGAAQARELFFYLLTHPGRTKEQIGLVFWPDLPAPRMTSTLHATLYRVRRAAGKDCIQYEGDRYAANPSLNYTFDVEQFESLLDEARASSGDEGAAARCYEEAIRIYRGDFLEDVYSDWALLRREALRERFVSAAFALAQYYLDQDAYPEAIAGYQKALASDEFREDIHQRLMIAYVEAGQRARALQHYEKLAAMMRSELGTSPSEDTVALQRRILATVNQS